MTDTRESSDNSGFLQPEGRLAWVRMAPAEGGVSLLQVVESADGPNQIYIPDEEIGTLIAALQHYLVWRQEVSPDLLVELQVWRVTGTILYDDADGEEQILDLDITIEAADEQEALRLILEQLQERYMGASWDGAPALECLGGQRTA